MEYPMGNARLYEISRFYRGSANEIVICREGKETDSGKVVMLAVKDRRIAKMMVSLFNAHSEKTGSYRGSFSLGDEFCFVFEYRKKRPILPFFLGNLRSLDRCAELIKKLVMECAGCRELPYPILFLIISQDQVHISQEEEIYFTYELDLAGLDENIAEKDCVEACAKLALQLLEQRKSRSQVMDLLRKKLEKSTYSGFSELYRDICMIGEGRKGPGLPARIREWWRRRRDLCFRILLVLCTALALAAITAFLSQAIWGDVPLLRLFSNGFQKIGTEYLN